MSEGEALEQAFGRAFRELCERKDPIVVVLTPLEAWAVMANIQLAVRHPENRGPTAAMAANVARQLQVKIAPSGALAAIAKRGWDARYDVET